VLAQNSDNLPTTAGDLELPAGRPCRRTRARLLRDQRAVGRSSLDSTDQTAPFRVKPACLWKLVGGDSCRLLSLRRPPMPRLITGSRTGGPCRRPWPGCCDSRQPRPRGRCWRSRRYDPHRSSRAGAGSVRWDMGSLPVNIDAGGTTKGWQLRSTGEDQAAKLTQQTRPPRREPRPPTQDHESLRLTNAPADDRYGEWVAR
jgi:hypothetical protein